MSKRLSSNSSAEEKGDFPMIYVQRARKISWRNSNSTLNNLLQRIGKSFFGPLWQMLREQRISQLAQKWSVF